MSSEYFSNNIEIRIMSEIDEISDILREIKKISSMSQGVLYFRGEKEDFGETALTPLIYRDGYIKKEDKIYRESQRFNDSEFRNDTSTFDKLSRTQHYTAPTRLIDISEDLLSALYFSIGEKDVKNDKTDSTIYIFVVDEEKIKYYDSDLVSVISNLSKIPLNNDSNKSKKSLIEDAKKHINDIAKFNECESVNFLLHEIRDEKPHFQALINPKHILSVQLVLPKLTSSRIRSQKGAFLLFGLDSNNGEDAIKLFKNDTFVESKEDSNHPLKNIHKLTIKNSVISEMRKELFTLGIKKSFIYPEIDKVSEFLKEEYKQT